MAEFISPKARAQIGTIPGSQGTPQTGVYATKASTSQNHKGERIYNVEIIRYDDAKGNNPVVIGTRNPLTGKITFNSNASDAERRNKRNLDKTTKHQLNVLKNNFVGPLTALEKETLNRAAGNVNEAINNGVSSVTPSPNNVPSFNRKRKSFKPSGGGALVYPTTLRKSQQDYLQIDMLEYLTGDLGFRKGLNSYGKRQDNRQSLGTVILPIPGGIADSNAVGWGEDSMTAGQAFVANIALTGMLKGLEEAGNEVAKGARAAANNSGELKKGLANTLANSASGTQSLLARTTGQVMNPNLELLFKNPTLRPFSFAFKLTPRSKEEAQTVIQIIRFFKQGMAPSKSESSLFLQSPNTFQLKYMHRGKEHKYLNRFKECALKSCTVQYTPDGNYATYQDGVMTAYNMTLAFQETQSVYSTDYEEDGITRNEIGY